MENRCAEGTLVKIRHSGEKMGLLGKIRRRRAHFGKN